MSLTELVKQNVKAGMSDFGEMYQTEDCYRCGFSGCKHDMMELEFNRQQEQQRREFKPSFGSVDPYLDGNMKIQNATPNTITFGEKLYQDENCQVTNSYIHHDRGPGRMDGPNFKITPTNDLQDDLPDIFNKQISDFLKGKK